jgi:hypothetical protein
MTLLTIYKKIQISKNKKEIRKRRKVYWEKDDKFCFWFKKILKNEWIY